MWQYLAIGAGVIVLALLGYFLYTWMYKKSGFTNSVSTSSANSGASSELMLFYADWCPHCKTAKPEWDAAKEYLHDNEINGQKVFCVEYNCSEKSDDINQIMNKYKVDGFPTIKLQYENNIHEFNEQPTKDNILGFLNSVLK